MKIKLPVLYFLLLISIADTSCTPNTENVKSNIKENYKIDLPSNSDIQKEWDVYKKQVGFSSFIFNISDSLKTKYYELKIEQYKNGAMISQANFDKNHFRNVFGGFPYNENISMYGFKRSDTIEEFLFYPKEDHSMGMSFYLEGEEPNSWTALAGENEPITLSEWQPILVLSKPPHDSINKEKCVFCELPGRKSTYKDWYNEYGFLHYYVVLLRFVE